MAIYPGLTPKKWASAYVILVKLKEAGVFLPEGYGANALMSMTQPELMDYVGRLLSDQCKHFWTGRVPSDLSIEIKNERFSGGSDGDTMIEEKPLVLDRHATIKRLTDIYNSC